MEFPEFPGRDEIAIAIGIAAANHFEENPDDTPEEFADMFDEAEFQELMITREQIIAIAEGAKLG